MQRFLTITIPVIVKAELPDRPLEVLSDLTLARAISKEARDQMIDKALMSLPQNAVVDREGAYARIQITLSPSEEKRKFDLEEAKEKVQNIIKNIWRKVAEDHNIDHCIQSIFDVDISDPNATAIEGRVRFIRSIEKWENNIVTDNPSWIDVFKAAEKSIIDTGDHHHRYLEAITKSTEQTEPGIEIYEIELGS